MRVDLPDPDEPMIATNSPGSTLRLTPRRACTSTSPIANTRVTFSTLSTCSEDGTVANPRSEMRHRRTRGCAARTALLGGDDGVVSAEVAFEDLCIVLVLEAALDRQRGRLPVAQDPDTRRGCHAR